MALCPGPPTPPELAGHPLLGCEDDCPRFGLCKELSYTPHPLEFFRGCGATNRRQCGQNLCLQRYEVDVPEECFASFSYCFHAPFRIDIRAHGDDLRHRCFHQVRCLSFTQSYAP